ncbi:MAG TPA: HAD family phosphatase [Blastocatellia bacterium]|nr:HAD family phosphatase [Blastocatellia bacterium]
MLKAIIFDCDGVIADSEPLHFAAMRQVLAEEGITLTEEIYTREYLALDDRGCYTKAFGDHGRPLADDKLRELIARKAGRLEPVMSAGLRIFPGVAEFIRAASAKYPLAVASGALRHEIGLILRHAGVRDCFAAIVSAEDVTRGKPDPESFLKAHAALSALSAGGLDAHECLVIEDSLHGVEAGKLAGMAVLAVTNSYPREQLRAADAVIESFAGVGVADVERLIAAP